MTDLNAALGLTFHHLGLAVHTPGDAFKYLAALGYREGEQCFDPVQKVNLAMRHHPSMPDVEVIWPGDGPSPIDRILKGRDSMIYHLCYRVQDVAAALAGLEAAGLQVFPLGQAEPATLFGGQLISFYMVSGIGVIELIHGPE